MNITVIDDPLEWQRQIDASGLHPNMRGSARFWLTVAELGGPQVLWRDGLPEFREIVFRVNDTLGISLKIEGDFIRYRFVEVKP